MKRRTALRKKILDVVQRVWYNHADSSLANTIILYTDRHTKVRQIDLTAVWLPALRIIEIILCVAVIIFVLLQVRGAGLGSAFGGSSAGSVFKTRRGVERLVFNLTIIFVVLFSIVSLLSALLR